MTSAMQRAVDRVADDVTLDGGGGADLVAVGVERDDCLELLQRMLKDEQEVTAEWLAVLVQWSVAAGVWLERARWQGDS